MNLPEAYKKHLMIKVIDTHKDRVLFDKLIDLVRTGESYLKAICVCNVPRKVVLAEYLGLTRIEDLPEGEKKELKRYVNELFPGKSVDERVMAAKVIYTIGYYL